MNIIFIFMLIGIIQLGVIIFAVVFLVLKANERKKEKQNENWDEYKNY